MLKTFSPLSDETERVVEFPRYQWREVYGVINVRPEMAPFDSENALFQLVPAAATGYQLIRRL